MNFKRQNLTLDLIPILFFLVVGFYLEIHLVFVLVFLAISYMMYIHNKIYSISIGNTKIRFGIMYYFKVRKLDIEVNEMAFEIVKKNDFRIPTKSLKIVIDKSEFYLSISDGWSFEDMKTIIEEFKKRNILQINSEVVFD
jgi:hypothetical protein